MATCATSPSGTGSFSPLRVPLRNVVRSLRTSALPGPSATASVPIASPEASFGSHAFFCASLPATLMASARQVDRGRERHRCQRRAQLLGQHAQAQMPEARPAVLLGDRRAGPAHGGDLRPQGLVVGLRPLQDLAHRTRGAALAQELPRLLAQLLQIVAEIEIHGRASHPRASRLLIFGEGTPICSRRKTDARPPRRPT